MLFESVDMLPSELRLFIVPLLRCWLRIVPSALRSLDMLLVPLLVPPVLLFIESLRIVPSALRLPDMPLLFMESVRMVPSALRLSIAPDVLDVPIAPVAPVAPIVLRLVLGVAASRFGTVEVLLLVVVEEPLLMVPVVLGLVLLFMPDELGRSLLPRVSGCLVVPGVPGAPGTLDCAKPMPATNARETATAMPRKMKCFMVLIPVRVGEVSEPALWVERGCGGWGKARAHRLGPRQRWRLRRW